MSSTNNIKKIIYLAALIVMAVISLTFSAVGFAEDLNQDLNDVNADLATTKDKIKDAEKQESDLTKQIRDLDQKIVAIAGDISVLEADLAKATAERKKIDGEISVIQQRIIDKDKEINETKEELKAKTAIYHERMVNVYKNGNIQYYEVLFKSKNIDDLLNRMSFMEKLIGSDKKMVIEVKGIKKELETQKESIEKEKASVEVKRAAKYAQEQDMKRITYEQKNKKNQLDSESNSKDNLLATVQDNKETYIQQQKELEASSREIAAKLRARQNTQPVGTGGLIWPTPGPITSSYGMRVHPIYGTNAMHKGTDIGAPTGQAISAAQSGAVITAGWISGYGNAVVIDHGGGLSTLYAHMSAIKVSEGQQVIQGDTIGLIGCTGSCTGPHLHYEVRVNGNPVDPMSYY